MEYGKPFLLHILTFNDLHGYLVENPIQTLIIRHHIVCVVWFIKRAWAACGFAVFIICIARAWGIKWREFERCSRKEINLLCPFLERFFRFLACGDPFACSRFCASLSVTTRVHGPSMFVRLISEVVREQIL